MTKNELGIGIKLIEGAYRKKLDKDEIDIWWLIFKNEDFDKFKNNVINYIENNHYLPVIADIKNPPIKFAELV